MYTQQTSGPRRFFSCLYRNRYAAYLLFMILMLSKLVFLHHSLNLKNIDMGTADYLVAAGALLLLSFWTLWLPSKGRIAALTLLNMLVTGLMFADLVFFRYFEDFITIPVLMQAGQVSSLGESIRSLIHAKDLFFFVDWFILVPWAASVILRKRRDLSAFPEWSPVSAVRARRSLFIRAASGLTAFILGLVLTFGPILQASKTWAAGLFAGNWWNVSIYNVTGLLGFHGYDAYRFARDQFGGGSLDEKVTADIRARMDDKRRSRASDEDKSPLFGKYKGSNVMVIQVEALMNFMINQSLNGQEITPNLNRLVKESMYFSQFYHQTALGRTSDADFVTQSSLLPLPAGSVFTRFPSHNYDTMPSILKDNGYAANVFHSYESSFWNRHVVYKEMNYDRFFSKNDFKQDEMVGWSVSDSSFFRQSLDMMKDIPQPFYSFLITLSSHHPYTMPKDEQKLNTGDFQGTMFGDYLQSIHYVDRTIGELEEQMKAQGLWDRSILVIYGDHDSSIPEKDDYEKFLGKPLSDLDMEQIMNQVPLLVRLPGGEQAGADPKPSGMMHIAPTIYHLLGISSEPYYLMGDSLTSSEERLVPLRSGAYASSRFFYIPAESGRFEDGTCYLMPDGKPGDVEACRPGFEESRTMLHMSDMIITHDLLKTFRQEQP